MIGTWALSILGGLILTLVVVLFLRVRRIRPVVDLEPEHSHPGRVLPPGMPMAQALQASPDDLAELALIRKSLPPEVAKIQAEKPRLLGTDAKSLLRGLLDGHFDGHLFLSLLDEKAILGAILAGNITVDSLPRPSGMFLTPQPFREPMNGLIYVALITQRTNSEPLRLSAVRDYLSQMGVLEIVGGEPYLKSLVELAATKTEALRILDRGRDL